MPIASCPAEIQELMTTPVGWEHFKGNDGHAQPSYAPRVTLYCWLEDHGFSGGGLETVRRPTNVAVDVEFDLFFAGDDPRTRTFTNFDRFAVPVVGIGERVMQVLFLATRYGPPFDNRYPWLVQVSL